MLTISPQPLSVLKFPFRVFSSKGQKVQCKDNTVGFENHDDLVAYQALIDSDDLSPEKLDSFLAEHTHTLRLDNLYMTVLGVEKPHRIHVLLVGKKSFWMDGCKIGWTAN